MKVLDKAKKELKNYANRKDALHLQKFFKTGKGEYGEGDIFIGVRVPCTRAVAKKFADMDMSSISVLLKSKIHEERLLALLILVQKFKRASQIQRDRIVAMYLKHARYINNWDLVDLSAHHILGTYLLCRDRSILYNLVKSKLLWERRIAVVCTFAFIRERDLVDTFRLSALLLKDKEDLMHKASGWMLREAGKRDGDALEDFLKKTYKQMPRTMLRYAIEKFPERKRQKYLKGTI